MFILTLYQFLDEYHKACRVVCLYAAHDMPRDVFFQIPYLAPLRVTRLHPQFRMTSFELKYRYKINSILFYGKKKKKINHTYMRTSYR